MPSLSLFISLSLYHSLLSLPHALLSKQSGLYQDEPQPKQAKQKIWARKSARRRGRILSCQPLCASLPTGDAPRRRPPLLLTHILATQPLRPESCAAFGKGLAPDLAELRVILMPRVKEKTIIAAKWGGILGRHCLQVKMSFDRRAK